MNQRTETIAETQAGQLDTIDQAVLTPLVQRALDRPTIQVTEWDVQQIHGGIGGGLFASAIFRFTGQARDQGQTVPWSLILKTFSPQHRFPFPDPDKKPEMQPVPDNRSEYLQAIFEGIARIEKQGYDLLEELANEPVLSIRSSGGGAANPAWSRIRERIVGRPMLQAKQTEAAYGSALLAAGML